MDLYNCHIDHNRARTESEKQKQALLDLPRPSLYREEGLEGDVCRDYDRDVIYIGLHIGLYTYIYISRDRSSSLPLWLLTALRAALAASSNS